MTDRTIQRYFNDVVRIRGYLNPTAAIMTIELLKQQTAAGISGNLLEIGVLGGRHLALMQQCLAGQERAFGVDPFKMPGFDQVSVWKALKNADCDSRVSIVEARSDRLDEQTLKSFSTLRFIHIDGSHAASDVTQDLEMCEKLLAPNGLISLDDFFNSYWLGVTEGFFRFFERHPDADLVPVGLCFSKLFLTRREVAPYYREIIQQFPAKFADQISKNANKFDPTRSSDLQGEVIPVYRW